MLIDVTLLVTPKMVADVQQNDKKGFAGHLGTHFDVMNKVFPLEYTRRNAIIFDIGGIKERDIGIADVDLDRVSADMFVAFCSGYIEEEGYGSKAYFTTHPQLSN